MIWPARGGPLRVELVHMLGSSVLITAPGRHSRVRYSGIQNVASKKTFQTKVYRMSKPWLTEEEEALQLLAQARQAETNSRLDAK